MTFKYSNFFNLDSKLIYFDNAATSIRPISFIDSYASLSQKSWFKELKTYDFINELIIKIANYISVDKHDISLVFNASMAINLIAQKIGTKKTVYLSTSEHLSNVLAWKQNKDVKEVIFFEISDLKNIHFKENSIVSISSMTNLVGEEIDFQDIKYRKNITLIIDASQTMQHKTLDLKNKNIDYLFFTAHKFFGPNGIAVIYSSRDKFGIHWNNKDNWIEENLDWAGLYSWNISFDEMANLFKNNVVQKQEEHLLNFFRENFPENDQVDWINKKTENLIFLLKTKNVPAHDFIFYLEKHKIIVRSGLCCSYSPEFKSEEHNIFRVSLSFLNTSDELIYLFKLITEYKAFMSF